jgi:aryl-alcohol dehydrogenase-like predicted oxidoreductase
MNDTFDTNDVPETLTLGGDLTVRRLGFGAMRLTGPGTWGEPADPAAARQVLRRAVELGVNFIDTADSYGPGVSERLIAEALRPYPDDLIIATKGGLQRAGPYQRSADCRPGSLRKACEASLRRLRLERIDLYQLHTVDPNVPLEESVGALTDLQAEGKVRHIGVSNFSIDELGRARSIAPVVSVQNQYNLVDRASDEMLSVCHRDDLAFIPWMPLARGTLARRHRFRRAADAHEATPAQVALVWLLQRSRVMLPIPGTSSLFHLEENMAARGLRLTDQDMAALAEYQPSPIEILFGRLRRKVRPLAVSVIVPILSLRKKR